MSWRLVLVACVHAAVVLVASSLDRPGTPLDGYLFPGVLSAQLALLGVWFGLGERSIRTRIAITFFGALGLCWVLVLRPFFNPWGLALAGARLGLFAVVFLSIRKKRRLILSRRAASTHERLIRLKLAHLLAFTFAVALFLAFLRALKGFTGPSSEILLVLVVLIVGLAGALVPMIAALGALSERTFGGALPYLAAVLVLAGAMGAFAYSQTDRWDAALQWSMTSLVEAATVGVSILALRLLGYRLATLVTI